MTYKYLVVIEKTGSGFSGYSPDVPGCIATGKTEGAVETAMSDAIEFHLEGLVQAGLPIPRPQARHRFAVVKSENFSPQRSKTAYHILPSEGKWLVKKAGATRASRVHSDKESAIDHARSLARKSSGKVVIHNKDGTVRDVGSRSTRTGSTKHRA